MKQHPFFAQHLKLKFMQLNTRNNDQLPFQPPPVATNIIYKNIKFIVRL